MLIRDGLWADGSRNSEKLTNPGKKHFLKPAVESVRAVSTQPDADGVSYASKAMIRCGMALNFNGRWEERQPFPEIHDIVRKYRASFDGEVVGST